MSDADERIPGRVGVVGGGSIGVAWSIVFARAGHPVSVFEPDAGRRGQIGVELIGRLDDLVDAGLLDEAAAAVGERVTVTGDLESVVADVVHVQECAPESAPVKEEIFSRLDRLVSHTATLASSSSAIPVSAFAAGLDGRARCLVAHPGNPPYLIPVVEVVPASFTAPWAIDHVDEILRSAGMSPVLVRREIEGFVFNRLQGALLREAYCLVRDGVITPRELDRVISDGLGRRWAVIGPFATAELNTRGGIASHAARLGDAYARMGAERGQDDPWTDDLVATVAADIHESLPPDEWEVHVRRRDRALMALERCRREFGPFMEPRD